MRFLANTPKLPALWEHIRFAYANTPLPPPEPNDCGLVIVNHEEKEVPDPATQEFVPPGTREARHVHWHSRADCPYAAWRPWARARLRARALSTGCGSYAIYSSPTFASLFDSVPPARRAEIVEVMAETEDAVGSTFVAPTCYDAWADVDEVPTAQEIKNEADRARSAMKWADAVRERTGRAVYAVVHEREKDTTTSPGRWLTKAEYIPVLEAIAEGEPDGVVHWTSPSFVTWAWTAQSDPKRFGYRAWYRQKVPCVPAIPLDDATWNGEVGKHVQTMLHGLAGVRAAEFREAIEDIFGASSAP